MRQVSACARGGKLEVEINKRFKKNLVCTQMLSTHIFSRVVLALELKNEYFVGGPDRD